MGKAPPAQLMGGLFTLPPAPKDLSAGVWGACPVSHHTSLHAGVPAPPACSLIRSESLQTWVGPEGPLPRPSPALAPTWAALPSQGSLPFFPAEGSQTHRKALAMGQICWPSPAPQDEGLPSQHTLPTVTLSPPNRGGPRQPVRPQAWQHRPPWSLCPPYVCVLGGSVG